MEAVRDMTNFLKLYILYTSLLNSITLYTNFIYILQKLVLVNYLPVNYRWARCCLLILKKLVKSPELYTVQQNNKEPGCQLGTSKLHVGCTLH